MKKLFDLQLSAPTTLSKDHSRERLEAVYRALIGIYSEYTGAEVAAGITRIRQDVDRERNRLFLNEQLKHAQHLLKEVNDRIQEQ